MDDSSAIELAQEETCSRAKLETKKGRSVRKKSSARDMDGSVDRINHSDEENVRSSKKKSTSKSIGSEPKAVSEASEKGVESLSKSADDRKHKYSEKAERGHRSLRKSRSRQRGRSSSKTRSSKLEKSRSRSLSVSTPPSKPRSRRRERSSSKTRSSKLGKSPSSSARSRSLSVSTPLRKPRSRRRERSSSKSRSSKLGKSPSSEGRSRSLSVSTPEENTSGGDARDHSLDTSGGKTGKHKVGKRKAKRDTGESGTSHDRLVPATSLSMIDEMKRRALNNHHASLNALIYKLKDTSLEEELLSLFKRIEDADGIPLHREPPLQANRITSNMLKVLRNDSDVTTLVVQEDQKFQEVDKCLPVEFAEGLRTNLHLTSVIITGVGLQDDFLIAIASSIRDNFTLENLILSNNCFTSNGLVEFCCCLGVNEALRTVDLRDQQNSVVLQKEHEREAMEALINNKYLHVLQMDVSTEKCQSLMNLAMVRNLKCPKYLNYDKKLLKQTEEEARNMEQLQELNLMEEKLKHQFRKELSLLSNLADVALINKAEIGSDDGTVSFSKTPVEGMLAEEDMLSDGVFLDDHFVSNFIVDDPSSLGVIFNFNGQSSLFRKFGPTHEARETIVTRFVDVLVNHSKADEMTRIIMRDSGCGDDFLIALCEKCQKQKQLLPKLFLLDLARNCVSDVGIAALSRCIGEKKSLRYLQVLRLQDQFTSINGKKMYFSLDSEFMLTKAVCQNMSMLRLSLNLRHLSEKRRIEGYLARNLEQLDKARIMKELSGKMRPVRNDLEEQIDRLVENDPAVWHVDFSADQRFQFLKRKDVLTVAKALANNRFVTEVRLDRLQLNDEFAVQLGESIASNHAVRILSLEGNEIGGRGVKAIISGLSKNRTLVEVNLRQQSEALSTADETEILGLLGGNDVVRKLALDVQNELVCEELSTRLANNQQSQWKSQRRSLSTEQPCQVANL